MRILMWDVHGGYTDALTRGPQEFCFLRDPTADVPHGLAAKGLTRLGADRPGNVHEVTLEELRDRPPDVVLAQRPIDTFGIDGHLLPDALAASCPDLRFCGNLHPEDLVAEVAQRRAYLHLTRWTSLGLSLICSPCRSDLR